MTREAAGTVSVPRDNARSERVCGGVSAAIEKGLVYAAAILTFAVLLFLIGYILMAGMPLANRNRQISTTAAIEASAQTKNTMCIRVSRRFFMISLHT